MKRVIAVIGESGINSKTEVYKIAVELGQALVDNGYFIQHGGRDGVMEAVTIGANRSKNYVPGCIIGILPGFSKMGANKFLEIAIPTGLDLMRNAIVVNADAVVAVGGGAGTLSEMAMAWTMKKLIIAYKTDGWSGMLAGKRIDNRKRINLEEDMVFGVTSAEEVISHLEKYLPVYSIPHNGILT